MLAATNQMQGENGRQKKVKKVVGCPSCKCYFLELIRLLNIQFFFIKTYFSRQFLR